jgi:hypothetical protein
MPTNAACGIYPPFNSRACGRCTFAAVTFSGCSGSGRLRRSTCRHRELTREVGTMEEMDAVRRHERGAGLWDRKVRVRTLGTPCGWGRSGPTHQCCCTLPKKPRDLAIDRQGPKLRQCSGLAELPLLLRLCAPSGLVLAHRVPGAFARKDAIEMASASITTRKTKGGGRRYVVRFRLGGRAYPIVHGGLFPTMREARIRRDLIAGELAAGRNPADALRGMAEPAGDANVRGMGEGVEGEPRRCVRFHAHRPPQPLTAP